MYRFVFGGSKEKYLSHSTISGFVDRTARVNILRKLIYDCLHTLMERHLFGFSTVTVEAISLA